MQGGTPTRPDVRHSPMASSPFPLPTKQDVIVNPDLTLIPIHSATGSQTHAATINSCTAIHFAWREEKMESPRFRERRNQQKPEDKRMFCRKGEKNMFSLELSQEGRGDNAESSSHSARLSRGETEPPGSCLSPDRFFLKAAADLRGKWMFSPPPPPLLFNEHMTIGPRGPRCLEHISCPPPLTPHRGHDPGSSARFFHQVPGLGFGLFTSDPQLCLSFNGS